MYRFRNTGFDPNLAPHRTYPVLFHGFILALLFLWISPAQAYIGPIYSGDWNDSTIWSDGIPASGTDVSVSNNLTLSFPSTGSATIGFFAVGYFGVGSMNLNGGTLTTSYSRLGWGPNSSGTATVTSGTWISTAQFVVGESRNGVLKMSGGNIVANTSRIGSVTLASGSATMTGGTWSSSSEFTVGFSGTGSLTLTGGQVNGKNSGIGSMQGSYGTATVSGGSWTTTDSSIYVGGAGVGTLNLSGSGVISVNNGLGTLTIGQYATGTGTLNLGDGNTVGTLQAKAISSGSGTATVNFNHKGDYTLGSTLSGTMSVNKYGTGRTILTGTNTYSGATTVSNGELDVNGSLSSSGTVSVGAGAMLKGSGTAGLVHLNGGTVGGTLLTQSISGTGTIAPGNSPGILTTGTIVGGGGLNFQIELTQSEPVYSSPTDSKNDLVHVTDSMGVLTSADQFSIYLSSATPGSSYLGGLFVDQLSASLLADAIRNASFLFYVVDADGTAETPGDIYYNGKYYISLDALLVKVSTLDVLNTSVATGSVASASEIKITVVPEPATLMFLVGGLGMLTLCKRRR